MRFFIVVFMIFFGLSTSYSDTWTSFRDEKTELFGFKDRNGKIVIKPKFVFTPAHKFLNIISVIEETPQKKYLSYFLTRDGRKVGFGKHYFWDNSPDCESDGTIRFRDKKVGFFDKKGDLLISPEYSDATPFRNGLAIVLKGATKYCFNNKPYSKKNRCEHWRWKGGKSFLINKENRILIENFKYTTDLSWLSLIISDSKYSDKIRDSFKGIDGKYYSFINYKKEFNIWFVNIFLKNFKDLNRHSMRRIYYWSKAKSIWIYKRSDLLFRNYKSSIESRMESLKENKLEYTPVKESANFYIFKNKQYKKYYGLCGEPIDWKYPVFSVMLSKRDKKGTITLDPKNYFAFLRTEKGYKLISFGIKGIAEFK